MGVSKYSARSTKRTSNALKRIGVLEIPQGATDSKKTAPQYSKYSVRDRESYDQYLKIKATLDNDPDISAWRTSDPNVTVSLLMSGFRLRNKISHLPEKERDKILNRHKEICQLKGKMSQLKMRAFGARELVEEHASILDGRKSELIEYFGRYFSCADVFKIVQNDWGIPCTYQSVTAFRKRHAEVIRTRQDEYAQDFSDVKLGYKRSRLEELSYLYFTRKQEYKRDARYPIPDGREMRALLEQIRHEMEGDKLIIEGDVKIQTEQRIEMHLFNQLMNEVSIKNLVLARVCARLRVEPLVLMTRLTNSYYNKYNGFGDEIVDDQPVYPSRLVYNFEEIARKQAELTQQRKNISIVPELHPDTAAMARNIKEELMKRIVGKKDSIKSKMDDISRI